MLNKRDKHLERFLTEGVLANPTGSSGIKYYDDPTTLGFNIFFEFDSEHSPLLNLSDKGESAVRYLEAIDEPERADALREFITRLRDVVTQHPYFFTTISGLESIYTFDPEAAFEYERQIEIETLESIDMRIGNIIERYMEASFDIYHRRDMLPENMRNFRFVLLISEIRNLQSFVGSSQDIPGETDADGNQVTRPMLFPENMKSISENLSTYVYVFDNCTFSLENAHPFLGSLTMDEPGAATNAFAIKAGRMQTAHDVKFLDLFTDEREIQGGREKLKSTAGVEEDRSLKGQLNKFKQQAGEFGRKEWATAQEFYKKEADEFLGENDPRRVASRFLSDQVARRLDSKVKQFLFGNVFLTPNTSNLTGEIGDVVSGREGIASLNPVRGRFGDNAKKITEIILGSGKQQFFRSNLDAGKMSVNPNELANRDVGELSENPNELEDRDVGEQSTNPNSLAVREVGDPSENPNNLAVRDVGEQSTNPNNLANRDVGDPSENPNNLAVRDVGDQSENSDDLSDVNTGEQSQNPDQLSPVILPNQSENPDDLGGVDAGQQSQNPSDLNGVDAGDQSENPSDLNSVETNDQSENPRQLDNVVLPESSSSGVANGELESVTLDGQSENPSDLNSVETGDKSQNPSDLNGVDAGGKSENPSDLSNIGEVKQSENAKQLERLPVGAKSKNAKQLDTVDAGAKSKNALRLGRTKVGEQSKQQLKSATIETGKRTSLGKKNFGKVETASKAVDNPSQFDKVDTGTPFESGIKDLSLVDVGAVKPMDFKKLFMGNVFGFDKKPFTAMMMTITAAQMGVVPVVAEEPNISSTYKNDNGGIDNLGKTTPLDKRKESKDDC